MSSYEHLVKYFAVKDKEKYTLYSVCTYKSRKEHTMFATTFRLFPKASCYMQELKVPTENVREVASYNVVHFLADIISINDLWDSGEAITDKKE